MTLVQVTKQNIELYNVYFHDLHKQNLHHENGFVESTNTYGHINI